MEYKIFQIQLIFDIWVVGTAVTIFSQHTFNGCVQVIF